MRLHLHGIMAQMIVYERLDMLIARDNTNVTRHMIPLTLDI